MTTTQQELKVLDRAEARAWRAMMNGPEDAARTVKGEEGVNYIAWCAAADACRFKRQEIEAAA